MKTQTPNNFSLSYGQQALWYLNQLEPHSTAYHLGICLRLTGSQDNDALAAAWIDIGNAHPQLRARFKLQSGQPFIEFAPEPAPMQFASGGPNDLSRFWRQIAGRPFNLESEAPARALLLRDTSQSSYLLLCMHHLIGDLWSSAILLRELSANYAARISGGVGDISPEGMSYDKFTVTEHNWLNSAQGTAAWEFWQAYLDGFRMEPILGRNVANESVGEIPIALDASLSALIQHSAREHETTPYSVLLAGYARLLGEETAKDELIIGTPATIRNHSALRNTVGYLVNAVPIRCPTRQNGKSVGIIAANARNALAHRRFPFSMLVERMRMPRAPGTTPLFQTMFAYQSLPRESSDLLPLALNPQRVRWAFSDKITAEIMAMPAFDPQFPLTLTLGHQDSEYSGYLQFDGRRVTRADAVRMADRFPKLMGEFLSSQKRMPVTVPRLERDERLEHLFDETARQRPSAIAISECGQDLTYAQVKSRAENLAFGLHSALAGQDGPVALQMSSCAEACIVILAILKSGRTFLPIDPAEPPVRRNAALRRTGACALISAQGVDPGVLPDGVASLFPEASNSLASPKVFPEAQSGTAYLIFTSGSTGEPKAVEVGHAAIINHARAMARLCNLSPQDRVLQFHTLAFDAALEEIFPTWASGARIVCEPQAREIGITAALEMVARNGITVLNLPTSYWHALTEEAARAHRQLPAKLRILIVGGERASEKVYAKWRKLAPRCRWINTYGPTETTVTALTFEPSAGVPVRGSLPIGRPIEGVAAFILDRNGKLVSFGEGELVIGGAGLALGYRGDPKTTADRFIIRMVEGKAHRFYRTGDRVKIRRDGNFEYLGRLDRQLKIRGHRVDPEEIERALHAHPLIADVAVGAQTSTGEIILTGWIVRTERSLTGSKLRAYLADRFPRQLIPSRLIFVRRIPRKLSGKIDQAKLISTGKRQAEQGGLQMLAALFSELLGHKIGPRDDFFLHGGHSLLGIRLLGRIENRYGVRLSVSDFMAAPTPEELWAKLQGAPRLNASHAPTPAPAPVETVVSAQQKRAFVAHEIGHPSLANIVLLLRVTGRIEEIALADALNAAARRNFLLRCGFLKTPEGIIARETSEIPDLECRTLQHDNLRKAVISLAKKEAVKPFTFDGRTPWFRLLLTSTPDGRNQHLILITHHAVADGWALELLLNEVRAQYEQIRPGRDEVPTLKEDYQAYALRQAHWLKTPAAKAQVCYWKNKLSGSEEAWLPFHLPAVSTLSWQTECHRLNLPLNISQRLRQAAASQETTLFALLMACFKAHIYRFAGQTDIMLGTVVSNRTTAANQNIIGPLQNPVFIRDEVTSALSMRELLRRVARSLAEAQENGALPIEHVLREALPHRPVATALDGGVQFLSHDFLAPKSQWGSAFMHALEIGLEESPFALSVAVSSMSSRIQIEFTYRSDACSGNGIRNLARQYETLLQSVAAGLDVTVGELNLTPADEARQFTRRVSRVHHPRVELLHAGFESQVRKNPNALAVISGNRRVSYGELNSLSNATARVLVQKELKAGGLVAVMLPKGWEQAVACLAVLKAGGAYVPMDPGPPSPRLKAIFQQGKFHAAIVSVLDRCHESWMAGLRSVVTLAKRGAVSPVHRARIRSDSLAYIIFTSGSTGVPKGVMIQHRAAMTTIAEINRRFQVRPDDRALAVSALGFDLSVFDLFGIFRAGGTVVVPRSQDPGEWLDQVLAEQVTIWNSVPCLFELLLDEAAAQGKRLESLRLILLSGDFIPLALARRIRKTLPQARLMALGGATEGAIWSIGHEITEVKPEWRSVPYGRALRGQEIFVLDRRLNHCPTGVKGELFIAGAGLARGYWRNRTETKLRFMVHPRWEIRLYRTGDQGRYLENGEIEILGRLDEQVKINGCRFELGEIEVALRSMPFIRQALAEVRADASGNKRIVAFVVASNGTTPSIILDRLRKQLPAAMVPTTCVLLDQLPLTANGKVDRQQLQTRDLPTSATSVASPENPAEQWILALWKSLLGDVEIGVTDDFFTVGGHSLLAIKMLQQVRSHFKLALPLSIIVESPTIRSLAAAISSASGKVAKTGLTRRATAELEADSDPSMSKSISESGRRPAAIFLTGATGHLGLALLVELLHKTSDHIYCLIRSSSREEGERRVAAALQSHGFEKAFTGRLTVVSGDLKQARFGLDPSAFNELAVNIRAIYHCAAEVNFVAPYEKLKAGNVEAVHEIIRLASLGGAALHHISSVAVFPYGNSQIRYEDEDIAQIKTLMGGYAQSKWVAERIVWKAIKRGLNAIIYRPAQIIGRQSVQPRQDIFDYILRACHNLQAIPDVEVKMDMITSDFAAKAIRVIASCPSSLGKAFHLVHPVPLPLRDFVRQLSIPLPIVPLASWLHLLNEKVSRSDDSALHFISMLAQGLDSADFTPPAFDCRNTTRCLGDSGIVCPGLDKQFIPRELISLRP